MIQYTSRKLEAVLTDQIWVRDCYGMGQVQDTPEVILDIGANVGSFSLYASKKWPGARVISLEPCASTYEVLCRNVSHNRQVTPVYGALGTGAPAMVVLGADSGSNRVQEGAGGTRTHTLASLCREYCRDSSYLIKLDCEGGEWVLWESADDLEALLGACAVSAELHYACAKWPGAPAIEVAEDRVRQLRKRWAGISEYYRLGKRAGMLKLRGE